MDRWAGGRQVGHPLHFSRALGPALGFRRRGIGWKRHLGLEASPSPERSVSERVRGGIWNFHPVSSCQPPLFLSSVPCLPVAPPQFFKASRGAPAGVLQQGVP